MRHFAWLMRRCREITHLAGKTKERGGREGEHRGAEEEKEMLGGGQGAMCWSSLFRRADWLMDQGEGLQGGSGTTPLVPHRGSGCGGGGRNRFDDPILAGSQCPGYLLPDSLQHCHRSSTQGGKQEGMRDGSEGLRLRRHLLGHKLGRKKFKVTQVPF